MTTLVGALLVSLGLDSAEFKSGLDEAQKRLKRTEKQFERMGKTLESLGRGLTQKITVPLLAIGSAAAFAGNKMADNAKAMENNARVANESFEKFQRLAYGAKQVGVEHDKLADILKDVQDKIGDFASTGGGEMTAFFENIAPKVGVTVDMFRNLSGKDALQLYYNSLKKANLSNAQMTFYLEAIGNDLTLLRPLLESNGRAWDEWMGGAPVISEKAMEGLRRYKEALQNLDNSWQKLLISLTDAGIFDVITGLFNRAAAAVERLSKTNPELLKWGAALGVIAAAVGPVLIGVGGLVKLTAPLLAYGKVIASLAVSSGAASTSFGGLAVAAQGMATSLAPIAARATVVGVAVAGIAKHWDKIAPVIESLSATFETRLLPVISQIGEKFRAILDTEVAQSVASAIGWVTKLGDVFAEEMGAGLVRALDAFGSAVLGAMEVAGHAISGLLSILTGDWVGAWRSAENMSLAFMRAFESVASAIFPGVGAQVRQMVLTIEKWIVGKLSAVWETAKAKINEVREGFWQLAKAVVLNSYVPDMVDGIRDEMARLNAVMVDPARKATQSTKEAFAQMQMDVAALLARIFPARAEINGLLADIALLDKAKDSLDLSTYVSAREKLQRDLEKAQSDLLADRFGISTNAPEALILFDEVPEEFEKFGLAVNDNAKRVEAANVRIVKSFKDAADETLSAISRMTDAVKGGDFLSILESVIGLGLQLASIGVFGSKVADRVNKPTGRRANGGPVLGGSSYLVGERGPEIFTPERSGQIIANDQIGRPAQVQIIPSKYFDVVVDGRVSNGISQAAPQIVAAGAAAGQSATGRRRLRSVGG